MAMSSPPYSFGEFKLNPASFELLRQGERIPIERLPMELLIMLVSRSGALVTREDIAATLWSSDVFIDTNTAINVAMRKIRQALDESTERPRFILTVPTKGYRFVGTLVEDASAFPETALHPHQGEERATQAAARRQGPVNSNTRFRRLYIGAIMALVATLVALLLNRRMVERHLDTPARLMFVVLPFANLTGDASQEYIADGMTEEMITRLGTVDPNRIGVIARTSSMRFKGSQKTVMQIAHELGVLYLLEGSVRRVGTHMRVTAQLIQASDQTTLWASDYDSDLGNLLQLQSDIADTIATQVQGKLSPRVAPQAVRRVIPQAQIYYLRGLEEWNLRTGLSISHAISEFQQAIALDPDYALPYAALARCYALGPVFGVGKPLETMPKARELAMHALQLDRDLASAYSVLAMVSAHYDYDWPSAEQAFQTALQLNPSDPYAHFFYSNSYLSPHGRHDEAIRELRIAIELDPLSMPSQAFLVRTYTWARRYDDARAQFEKTNEVAPNLPVLHERAAHLFADTGDFQRAVEEDATASLLSGHSAEDVIARKTEQLTAWKQGGAAGYWKSLLALSTSKTNPPEAYASPFGLAIIQARLGWNDRAFDSLEQAIRQKDVQLTEIDIEPAFDRLRPDPRFSNLLDRVHLRTIR